MSDAKLTTLKHLRALIADDDTELLQSMQRILGAYFGEVLLARTGVEAWSHYERHCPDVVFLDIAMPGESGLAVARQIREADPDLPIALITGHDGRAELLEAIPLGLVEFLVKPINIDSLHHLLHGCVKQLMRRGRLRHELPGKVVYLPAEGKLIDPDGTSLSLSRNEQRFLTFMLARRSRIVATETICRHLLDPSGEEMSPQALRNLVHRLRAKVGRDALVCHKDFGYLIP